MKLTAVLPLLSVALFGLPALGADGPRLTLGAKFTGNQSCATTGCHGGGTIHNESITFERKDPHAVSYGILGKGTSLRMAEALGIKGDPAKSEQCNVCHAPMQGLDADLFVKDLKPDRGVSCESCHGAAENWLRFHTRPDVDFKQIVAAGMRDLNDIYGRANSCVGCHLNLDESLRKAGHPELFFELDGQCAAQPPHYRDARPALGPRSWLTGQAAALREMSWKLSNKGDENFLPRWKAMVWLLQKTELGKQELPASEDFATMQKAADGLARKAALKLWTREEVRAQLKELAALHAEFEAEKADRPQLQRKAEVLVPALDRLWRDLVKGGASNTSEGETSIRALHVLALDHEDFDPARFSGVLSQFSGNLAQASSSSPAGPGKK
jgi:hypothetical protein